MMEVASDSNEHKEPHMKESKDKRKKRTDEDTQPATLEWRYIKQGCNFVVKTKAGLVNHKRQRHDAMLMEVQKCPFGDQTLQKQGLLIYTRYHQANPKRKKSSLGKCRRGGECMYVCTESAKSASPWQSYLK